MAAVLDSPELRLVDIDNTETNRGLGSDAAALFSRSFGAFSSRHPVRTFDGRTLDFDDDQYDVALLTYVLHHAAGDTISLLKEAKRVARNYVSSSRTSSTAKTTRRTPSPTTRAGPSDTGKEWAALFDLLGFEVVAHGPCNSNGLAAFRHTMSSGFLPCKLCVFVSSRRWRLAPIFHRGMRRC